MFILLLRSFQKVWQKKISLKQQKHGSLIAGAEHWSPWAPTPRHQEHCWCTNHPSLFPLTSHLYLNICDLAATMDTSHIPYWQKSLYWTAFSNTLFYLLTREPTTVRLQHRIALAMGCYTHAFALFDEARKQQYVSSASMIISAVAVCHMIWMYRQRRDAR